MFTADAGKALCFPRPVRKNVNILSFLEDLNINEETTAGIELGALLGRGQAFGVVANGCAAAQAECLRQIHDSGAYKATGLEWNEFCPQYAGLSRPRVDALIHNLNEFGRAFFDLSEIVKVSPEAYRRLADKIKGKTILIGTEEVPIAAENAVQIRREVQRLHAENRKARSAHRKLSCDTNILFMSLESCFERMRRIAGDSLLGKGEEQALRDMLAWYNEQSSRIERDLDNLTRAGYGSA